VFNEGLKSVAWNAQYIVIGFAGGGIPKVGSWGAWLEHRPACLPAARAVMARGEAAVAAPRAELCLDRAVLGSKGHPLTGRPAAAGTALHTAQVPANILLVKNTTLHGTFWGSYMEHRPALVDEGMRQVGPGPALSCMRAFCRPVTALPRQLCEPRRSRPGAARHRAAQPSPRRLPTRPHAGTTRAGAVLDRRGAHPAGGLAQVGLCDCLASERALPPALAFAARSAAGRAECHVCTLPLGASAPPISRPPPGSHLALPAHTPAAPPSPAGSSWRRRARRLPRCCSARCWGRCC
jgi:hypothetical protein